MSRRHFVQIATAGVAALELPAWAGASAPRPNNPDGACDCHVHIIGPSDRYPMAATRTYTPPQASVKELREFREKLGFTRTVLVQPSFYGTDNRCLMEALGQLGDTARGIAVLAPEVSPQEIKEMDRRGIRGVRANLETNGSRDVLAGADALKKIASRIAPFGWHLQIYAALAVIAGLAEEIAHLPVPVVFDHFGMASAQQGVGQPGFDALLSLLRHGRAYVKLSAPYRISAQAPDYPDVLPIAQALIEAGPGRVVWGSDWPHTNRVAGIPPTAVHPFKKADDLATANLLAEWCPDAAKRRAILVDTPASLYRF